MKVNVKFKGFKAVDAKLSRLSDGSPRIARAAVNAGLRVLAAEVKTNAPGTIKREVGWYSRMDGGRAWGRAGLMQFPRQGDGQNGPHGVYVDQGTKFIQARHFVGRALSAAMPRAIQAAKNVGIAAAKSISKGQ